MAVDDDVLYGNVSGATGRAGGKEGEYGAVRLAPGSRRTLETNVDECVYAQPRRTRP